MPVSKHDVDSRLQSSPRIARKDQQMTAIRGYRIKLPRNDRWLFDDACDERQTASIYECPAKPMTALELSS